MQHVEIVEAETHEQGDGDQKVPDFLEPGDDDVGRFVQVFAEKAVDSMVGMEDTGK